MSEREKSRMITLVLILLFIFSVIMVCRGEQKYRGAEVLKHESRLSYYKKAPTPPIPPLAVVPAKVVNSFTVDLAWDASPSTNVIARYEMGYGPATRTYTNLTSSGLNLTVTIGGLDRSARYYFAVRAVANQVTNAVSEWSNEICLNGLPRTNRVLTLWSSLTNWPVVSLTNQVPNFFYRTKTTKLSANRYRTVAQRAPMINGLWEEWTNYWAPLTNTIPTSVRLFIQHRRE